MSKKATDNVELSPKDITYILQPISCGGRKTEHTCENGSKNLIFLLKMSFFLVGRRLFIKSVLLLKNLNKIASAEFMSRLLNLIFVLLYLDYSVTEEFEKQFEINSKRVVGFIESVIDMFSKQN